MSIVIHSALSEVSQAQWNALVADDYPFIKHEFLSALESSGCVCSDAGWNPCHVVSYRDDDNSIEWAMPCYEKDHSYGEYIFDWAWADAYRRYGRPYYPKLSTAIPFTPATGQRVLMQPKTALSEIAEPVVESIASLLDTRNASSWHGLFLSEQEVNALAAKEELLIRHSNQYHWHNQEFDSFDDFLASLTSKKRKNIKRERRRVTEMGIRYEWVTGDALTPEIMRVMHGLYRRTIGLYGAYAYLNSTFFTTLAEQFNQNTLVLLARFDDQVIAGGLYFRGKNTLFGRYWGALDQFDSLHFETCYYQAIEWCINHQMARFEAGAQGEHKIARGLVPTTTHSAHFIKDPEFKTAIANFVTQEQDQMARFQNAVKAHSPYRSDA